MSPEPPGQPPLGRWRSCWSVHDRKMIITFKNSAGEPYYDSSNPLAGNTYDEAHISTESKIKCYCIYQKPLGGGHDVYDNLTGGACYPFFPQADALTGADHPWSTNCRIVKKVCHPCRYASLDVTPGNLPAKPCIPNLPEYWDVTILLLYGAALQANGTNNEPRGREAYDINMTRVREAVKDAERAHEAIMNCRGETDDPTVPGCFSIPTQPPPIPSYGQPGHHGFQEYPPPRPKPAPPWWIG